MGVVFQPHYSLEALHRMLESFQFFAIGASWGGFESLVLPTSQGLSRAYRAEGDGDPHYGLGGPTARFHIGLEDVQDLKNDLERGLKVLKENDEKSGGGL